jgi:tRNA threonylcarbamoyladenosine biosynthesis protein TsaE
MNTYIAQSVSDMHDQAKAFAETLRPGDVIGLIGPLGAGKTTFVRGIIRALGGKDKVKSPSYTLMQQYDLTHSEIHTVIHMDWYRFQDPVELESLGLDDAREGSVLFIEWPDVFEEHAFPIRREVRFAHIDEHTRSVSW